MRYSNGIAHSYDFFAPVWCQTGYAVRFLIELAPPESSILEIGTGKGVTAAAADAAALTFYDLLR